MAFAKSEFALINRLPRGERAEAAEIHVVLPAELVARHPLDMAVQVTFVRTGGFFAMIIEVIYRADERVGVTRPEP